MKEPITVQSDITAGSVPVQTILDIEAITKCVERIHAGETPVDQVRGELAALVWMRSRFSDPRLSDLTERAILHALGVTEKQARQKNEHLGWVLGCDDDRLRHEDDVRVLAGQERAAALRERLVSLFLDLKKDLSREEENVGEAIVNRFIDLRPEPGPSLENDDNGTAGRVLLRAVYGEEHPLLQPQNDQSGVTVDIGAYYLETQRKAKQISARFSYLVEDAFCLFCSAISEWVDQKCSAAPPGDDSAEQQGAGVDILKALNSLTVPETCKEAS